MPGKGVGQRRVLPELDAFYEASARSGAYEVQCDSGDAAHAALESLAQSEAQSDAAIEALEAFVLELDRLLVNISCRINLRRPEILRPLRTRLNALRRRATLTLKGLGVSNPSASHTKAATAPRRIADRGNTCRLMDEVGPRHVCEHGCFFREYEPSRMLRTFLSVAADEGHRRSDLAGWKVEVRRTGAGKDEDSSPSAGDTPARKRRRAGSTSDEEPWLVAPTGEVHLTVKEAVAALDACPQQRGAHTEGPDGDGSAVVSRFFAGVQAEPPRHRSAAGGGGEASTNASTVERVSAGEDGNGAPAWRPPQSPYGLLEELLWDRPWRLLLACILLNQTSRAQVDPVLARLLDRFPDAPTLAGADATHVEEMLRPLGLHRRRARTLLDLSAAFLKGTWRRAEELPGIGQYAADAYAIFCEGRWRETEPQDHALRWYTEWLRTVEDS